MINVQKDYHKIMTYTWTPNMDGRLIIGKKLLTEKDTWGEIISQIALPVEFDRVILTFEQED